MDTANGSSDRSLASDMRMDMYDVSLEPQPSQSPAPPAARLSNMLGLPIVRMLSVPKLLPMLYTIFCLKLQERKEQGLQAHCTHDDVEVAVNSEEPPRYRQIGDHNSIFLVPRLPDSTLFVSRPSVQRASSRFFSWIKHSIFRVPRRTPILG